MKFFVIGVAIAAAGGAAPPEILTVRQTLTPKLYQQIRQGLLPPTTERTITIARYEKLELRVDLRATYQNTYDPDEVDLWAEFTAPSGRVWKIWGSITPRAPRCGWCVWRPTRRAPGATW